jgi:hypothetical protein
MCHLDCGRIGRLERRTITNPLKNIIRKASLGLIDGLLLALCAAAVAHAVSTGPRRLCSFSLLCAGICTAFRPASKLLALAQRDGHGG